MEKTAHGIWKELENARSFKSQNNLYEIAKTNEKFIHSEQWDGIPTKGLAPNVYNFIGQVAKTQVSSVMSQQLSITRSADATSVNNQEVIRAAKIFTQLDSENWEFCKMDALNEDLLNDAFTTGLGGTYWWWDEELETGNDFINKGNFRGVGIDAISLYVCNPNDLDLQKQDFIILSIRKTIPQAKEFFKSKGVSDLELEQIKDDESTVYEAYDKAQVEQTSDYKSGQVTIAIKMYKENKRVMCIYSTANVATKPIDTELTLYPIAYMNWDKRKSYIYGVSPITGVVVNQKTANIQSAIKHLSAQLMAIPKLGFNSNMVSGVTSAVGGMYEINAEPGANIGNAIHYWQPTSTSIDLDKSIDQSIERTKSLMGANQALLGESNPDNFKAILAQQKQAGIPLESVKRRYIQYIEDVAAIWCDFYKNKYKLNRSVMVEEQQETFVGTDYKDIYLNTKVDVGASTQYSEIVQVEIADKLWEMQIVTDPVLYLEMLPENLIPMRQKIIDSYNQPQQIPQEQPNGMDEMLSQMSPEALKQFQALPLEQQQQLLQEFIGGA